VTRADSKQFGGYLENAATMGRPLLVQDIDEPFDRTTSRLAKLVRMERGEWQVKVSDKEVKVADGFRLYLTTKLARPLLTREVPAYVNVVDFTLSEDAVTDELLSCIFQHDKPVSSTDFRSIRPCLIIFLALLQNIVVNIFRLIITMNG